MELLVFGHGGVPVVVFPTSQGRFYEFEDRGMVGAIAHKIDNGEIQFYCLDSVDAESWYNRAVPPRWRIARHVQYDSYVIEEVLPLIRLKNWNPHLASLGCSFGGYHAVNIALRHPDRFTGFLSMSGAFDMSRFLNGYHDDDVYFNTPNSYLRTWTTGGISSDMPTVRTSWLQAGTTSAWEPTSISRGRWARNGSRTSSTSGTHSTAMTGQPGVG